MGVVIKRELVISVRGLSLLRWSCMYMYVPCMWRSVRSPVCITACNSHVSRNQLGVGIGNKIGMCMFQLLRRYQVHSGPWSAGMNPVLKRNLCYYYKQHEMHSKMHPLKLGGFKQSMLDEKVCRSTIMLQYHNYYHEVSHFHYPSLDCWYQEQCSWKLSMANSILVQSMIGVQ